MATYVLVPGAWCTGDIWSEVAGALRASGHRVEVVDRLPSTGPGLGDLAADTAHLRALLDRLADVVLVAHSYGGFPATDVADHPALRHTVYLAAFRPRAGESLLQLRSAHPRPWSEVREDGTIAVTDDDALARSVLAADLAPERFAQLRAGLQVQSVASFAAGSGAPARHHPITYVVCLQDRAIRIDDQRRMSAGADHVVEIDAAHMVMVSAPAAVVAVLLQLT